MGKMKEFWGKLNFKIKMGLLFCLIPVVIWSTYLLIYFLCRCRLYSFFELPLLYTWYLAGFYEGVLMKVFTCGMTPSPNSNFDCIVGPILFVILYFLTFFLVGVITGYAIEKIRKKTKK